MITLDRPLARHLLADSAVIAADGRLSVGGMDVVELADSFGTPLFVYDEAHLRNRCREAVAVFGTGVAYGSKAFGCLAMAELAAAEGMVLDVATGGELHTALAAGASPERIVLHGNNKSQAELVQAADLGVKIVVDSFDELDRLESIVAGRPVAAVPVMVRVTPGVEAHTHEFVRTGQVDSKFGFGLVCGDAALAVERVRSIRGLAFVGIHVHIGSQIFALDSFAQTLEVMVDFVAATGAGELCIGGGLGVAYLGSEAAPTITQWAAAVHEASEALGIEARITAEPGRSIVATAGMTLYRVGTIKEVPGVRTYVSVDGGMSDNPRPVLYGSGYEAFLPRSAHAARPRSVTVVGKHCESGDLVVRDAQVPEDLAVGDVLATPVTGAYGHSMASNYNRVGRPPVVFVADGSPRLVVRRETNDDLLRLEESLR